MAPHTIVVLGAGLGGIPITHWLMKHQVPTNKDLKVVLVSPTSELFWNIAAPRAVLPGALPDDKVFYPIASNFAKYPQHESQFEFIVGKAEALDPTSQTVTVAEVPGGAHRSVRYDTLVVATGSSARADMPWKSLGSTQETKEALRKLQKAIGAAKHIVVAGGGQTGSELAGELGSEYAAKGLKQVTFVIDDDLPLTADARRDVRQAIASRLESFKVRIVRSARVTASSVEGGKTVLELTSRDGGKKQQSLEADLYLPTVGLVPNSDFAPSSMLDAQGRFKQTASLRAEGFGNVFVLGDVGNLQTATAKHAGDQVQHLTKVLGPYLSGGQKAEPAYKADNGPMFAVTLGKSHGIGQMGTWKLWSWLVAMVKSKHMGTNMAPDSVTGAKM
ncbi:uncharacterized protein E0L32_009136 [Thyridium curvatum]|uniref:FAD/NAD(P)-binding domain-containing protein n=1 Tax=Thyridium curvatum TaxID=1093900 RepID=A0A507APG4_9PEZI|nr:uncharacterized protein E0L32_009136 [Thyridium curvatum]TPX09663.1 hypothetical protein E0L32_009136 [Thyridium curvatum]